MTMQQTAAEQDEVMHRLEERRHVATPQRRAILAALMKQPTSVTPRELHVALREEQPAIGQATVYRTLELLVEVGAATSFLQDNNESKYVYCSPRHHHHLVCTRCGRVEDLDGCLLSRLGPLLEQDTLYQITGHAITLYGYCGDCKVC
jgi:Fur family ferric uptake transcriptional regulator